MSARLCKLAYTGLRSDARVSPMQIMCFQTSVQCQGDHVKCLCMLDVFMILTCYMLCFPGFGPMPGQARCMLAYMLCVPGFGPMSGQARYSLAYMLCVMCSELWSNVEESSMNFYMIILCAYII